MKGRKVSHSTSRGARAKRHQESLIRQVIAHAGSQGDRSASREFVVSRNTVREWRTADEAGRAALSQIASLPAIVDGAETLEREFRRRWPWLTNEPEFTKLSRDAGNGRRVRANAQLRERVRRMRSRHTKSQVRGIEILTRLDRGELLMEVLLGREVGKQVARRSAESVISIYTPDLPTADLAEWESWRREQGVREPASGSMGLRPKFKKRECSRGDGRISRVTHGYNLDTFADPKSLEKKKEPDPMRFVVTIDRDEDGVFVVECPSIPGCISQGKSEKEALRNIKDAIMQCLEVRAERGMPLTVTTREIEVSVK